MDLGSSLIRTIPGGQKRKSFPFTLAKSEKYIRKAVHKSHTHYPDTMQDIKPFDPRIPQEEVSRLFRKLRDTRLPEFPIVPDAKDDYGSSAPLTISGSSITKRAKVRHLNGLVS